MWMQSQDGRSLVNIDSSLIVTQALALRLGSYGGEDSPLDISRECMPGKWAFLDYSRNMGSKQPGLFLVSMYFFSLVVPGLGHSLETFQKK